MCRSEWHESRVEREVISDDSKRNIGQTGISVIQQLKRKLAQEQDVVTQQVDQMQELEEYIRIQEDSFAGRMFESILQATVA